MQNATVGIFEDHTDVGTVFHAGSVDYDAAQANLHHQPAAARTCGSRTDAFQFVWKKVSGDVTLTADISFSDEDWKRTQESRSDVAPEPRR